jgi:mannosyltransferase OCH1-like enzyme
MAKKLDQKQIVDFKELLMSEVIQSEAIINHLDRKGILFNDPKGCAENDRYRSSYVRSLVQTTQSLPEPPLGSKNTIPKVIVQFWDNLGRIPKDVQECLDTWEPLAAHGFARLIFDDRKARSFIFTQFGSTHVAAFDRCYHPAMRCDYFRLCYILSSGGFYVDADEMYQGMDLKHLFDDNRLKLQPLCYDTETGEMIKNNVFMKDRQYSPNWIFYFANTPIIAPAGHPIIRLALERATGILINSSERLEIQSTTGPGNLTASLVRHAIYQELSGEAQDFLILSDWESTSIICWPLSYRNDARNWRLSNTKAFVEEC